MLKKLFILIISLVCLLSISCNDTEQVDSYYTFFDSNNNKVILSKKPEKVAILFSSFVEIWNIAGGNTAITVGESIERGFVEQAILVDSKAGKVINNELLLSANPDFVICSADIQEQVKTFNLLNNVNIPSALIRVESFEDYLWFLNICTDILKTKDKYEEYGTNVENKIKELLINYNDKNSKILFIRAASNAKSTKAKGTKDHFVCKMLNELGMLNIADEAKVLLDGLSIEEILIQNPDYIFISLMGDEESSKNYMDSLINSDIWKELNAIRNGKYYYLPKELFQYKPNQKWDKAYEYLVDIIYEEI